jgi:hypothetical protein
MHSKRVQADDVRSLGKLGFAPPASAEGSPVTSTAPQPAASSACQVGGAKA